MKELEKEFFGRGEVKGFYFKQIKSNQFAYIYEVHHPDVVEPHYSVFERRVNKQFDCESYPNSNSFGIWAWCCVSLDAAEARFEQITERLSKKAKDKNSEIFYKK